MTQKLQDEPEHGTDTKTRCPEGKSDYGILTRKFKIFTDILITKEGTNQLEVSNISSTKISCF
jgi:hypothetical protein